MAPNQSRYYTTLLWGLLLFGLSLPLSKSAGNVLLFLIYPATLALIWYDRDFRASLIQSVRQPLIAPLLLFYCLALLGVLYTENYTDGFHIANKFSSLPAIYFMVAILLQANRDEEARELFAEYLLFSLLIGLFVLNAIAAMTYLGAIGHKKYMLPLAPLNVHHIWFSNLNAIGLYVSASFLLFSPRGRKRWIQICLIAGMAIGLLCILLSISRTAWFGTLFTALIMTYVVMKKKKIYFAVLAAAAAGSVLLYLFNPIVHGRIDQIVSDITRFFAGDSETSLGQRFIMWEATIRMFLSNPLFGVGTGDYNAVIAQYVAAGQLPDFVLEFNQPHNMYLFTLATNGLLGLGALLYLFYRGLRFALPRAAAEGRDRFFAFVALATIVHFMIAGLTDSFFNIQMLRYTFAFVMGVTVREFSKGRSKAER